MSHLLGNLMKTGTLVPVIQAVEGFVKQQKTKVLLVYISKSIFASSDSFCLITLHHIMMC